jgi:hypothetical protein
LRKEVTFLGYKISQLGIGPNSRKIEVIKNFPTPKTVKQLTSFLGIRRYYRKYAPQFSKKGAPYHKLLKRYAK